MFYVYILRNHKSKRLYKGSCNDLKKRIKQHNQGLVRSTRSEKRWNLLYYEAFVNKTDCLREEKFLKTGKGRERLRLLLINSLKSD